MKKLVWKFWCINLLISIALFIIYRIVISQTTTTDKNWFETIISILGLLIDLGFSIIYLVAMLICSFAIFLNLKKIIRNNFYLSLLTFLGIPAACIIYLIINVMIDLYSYNQSVLTKFFFFSNCA